MIISTKSFFYSKGTEGRELKLLSSLKNSCEDFVVQTDGIDFRMYYQRPFEWYSYDMPTKAEN